MLEVDIGFAGLVIFSSIVGSIVQFWVTIYKEETEIAGRIFQSIASEMKEMPEGLKKVAKKEQSKILREFVKSKRRTLRSKYLDKWWITLFFGLVAGILYLLIGPLEPNVGYFVTAAVNGYAGESFVVKVLDKESPEVSWSNEEFQGFQSEYFEQSM